jgi:hypothetical protein
MGGGRTGYVGRVDEPGVAGDSKSQLICLCSFDSIG